MVAEKCLPDARSVLFRTQKDCRYEISDESAEVQESNENRQDYKAVVC